MSLSRRVARPLLASIFLAGGLDAARNPAGKAAAAEKVLGPLKSAGLPGETEQHIRLNGVVQVGAGALLAAGRLPRLAAAVLACSLIPTTAAGHRFWELNDPASRAQQRTHFLKNLGLLGGLILAVFDTGGRRSASKGHPKVASLTP